MKLISSKKTKRRIALLFIFAFMLSNVLTLFGPSAKAAVTNPNPTAGICFQHSGTEAAGALVTIYKLPTLQFTLLASDLSPGQDTAAVATANAATVRAVFTDGGITDAEDVQGNVVSIIPPTGTNFVVVPGFADSGGNRSNVIASTNVSISGAQSQDATGGANTSDLAIEVGIPTTGTVGVGRAIIAIARDSDTTTIATIGAETYPKSGTASNTATITINGLGVAVPSSGEGSLSGTLVATLDATPPAGIGTYMTGNNATANIASAIPSLSGTFNVCTITSPAGQLEALSDTDSTTDLYDKNAATANLLALSQIGTAVRVHAFDTNTVTAAYAVSVNGTNQTASTVDLEPILIRGKAGTGTSTRDQVFATGDLASDIDTTAEAPGQTGLDITTTFGNSTVAPITVAFTDDSSATSTVNAVQIIIENTTAGAVPAAAGLSATQTSRLGFLGASRAAVFDSGQATTNTSFRQVTTPLTWGVAAVAGGPNDLVVQEVIDAAGTNFAHYGTIASNALEPFDNAFVDLRISCDAGTSPVSGWFAIVNSNGAAAFGTTTLTEQGVKNSQAGGKILTNSQTNFFRQNLTNIAGTNPAPSFMAIDDVGAMSSSTLQDNAILYASCTNNTLTIVPIQNGFDETRDILAITPFFSVTGISNTFSSDINLIAQISGNNLTGTTSINPVAKLVGAPPTGDSTLVKAQGAALSENSQLGVDCSSGGTASVVLSGVSTGTFDAAVAAACTGGVIAPPGPLFTGGAPNTVSGTTVIDGSPVVQGEGRLVLLVEQNETGFAELVQQVGGGTQGTAFSVSLPSGCDVIDDLDDNNTASTNGATAVGNDVTRTTVTSTAGVSAAVTAGGAGNAALTNANVLEPASGINAARMLFRLTTAPGTGTDAVVKDAVALRIDAQDVLCPHSEKGKELEASVLAGNQVNSPTTKTTLGKAKLGTAVEAAKFAFTDDVAKSTKLEVSTNSNIGSTPRLVGGGVTTSNPFVITENHEKSFPVGGRVAPRNLDPENSLLSSLVTKFEVWLIPATNSAFSTAPVAADITISDDSLVLDGSPTIVTSATVDPNAPTGTLKIGLKRNTATGAKDPATVKTSVTVKNLKLSAATSSTTDLVSSVIFFVQDAGVVVNTPGSITGSNAQNPTVFTPYVQASPKALNQLEAAGVQLTGALANQQLTSRLTTQGSPQLNPFAKVITTAMAADANKITVTGTMATTPEGTKDNVITVTGTAGAVDGGADITVSAGSGSVTYDSVTVKSSDDGSFKAIIRGDCSTATSVTVTVSAAVSGTASAAVTKTSKCTEAAAVDADAIFTEIAGTDGVATIDEVLSYVTAQGGLSSIVSEGGGKLEGLIKAAKAALGLS